VRGSDNRDFRRDLIVEERDFNVVIFTIGKDRELVPPRARFVESGSLIEGY
jgi:hypothetical protein